MKRILTCILSALLCIPFHAQDDPVVMTVNGYDVKKTEFEYFFRKNNTETEITKKTVNQYADLYLNFKLKVQAAIDEGMDKSESFLSEYGMCRDAQAEDYVIDKDYLESKVHEIYEQSLEDVGEDGLAFLYVISSIPQDETDKSLEQSFELMKSVYEKLKSGESFQAMAREYSSDDLAAGGGEAGWVSRIQLPEDVAEIVFSLEAGQYSEPFISEGVAFIVMVTERRSLGSFEENYDDIYKWLIESGAFEEAKRRKANEYATRLGWKIRDDKAVAYLDSVLEEIEPEFGNISREYHDGLLVFDISNREIWERVSNHPEEMETYFNSHKKQFKFSEPCFKGIVLFCKNENIYNELKSILDGVDMSEWIDKILDYNKEEIKVRVMRGSSENGIFKQGQNAYVDKIVFGKGSYEPMSNYPYVNVIGRVLKQPDSVEDVTGEVADAYQNYLEKEWVKKLRGKYKYKINKKALKTVNLDK